MDTMETNMHHNQIAAAQPLSEGVSLCAAINTHWQTSAKTINDDHLWDHILKPLGLIAHLELAYIARQFVTESYFAPTMSESEQYRRLDEYISAVSEPDYWDAINIKPKRKRHAHKTALWQIITQVDEVISEWGDPRTLLFRKEPQ